VLGCGAPLLLSKGLVDAMRIGPDVIDITDDPARMSVEIEHVRVTTTARAWMQARLWTNDPDHLLVRQGIAVRDAWAEHIAGTGGFDVLERSPRRPRRARRRADPANREPSSTEPLH
jgi:alpha-galactosidase